MNENTKLPSEIMAKPAISWEEWWGSILGIAESTAEMVARQEPKPNFFLIGRRRYIKTSDAVAWVDAMADTHEYVPRKNKRDA